MKEILLTQGKFALVDDEDFDSLNQYKWFYNSGYAVRWQTKTKKIFMHRVVLNITESYKEKEVDHISGNGIDNRKENLRVIAHGQNSKNRKIPNNNSTGYKGVHYQKDVSKYVAYITANKVRIYLGLFLNKEDAALAYNKAALEHHGEFAQLNNI